MTLKLEFHPLDILLYLSVYLGEERTTSEKVSKEHIEKVSRNFSMIVLTVCSMFSDFRYVLKIVLMIILNSIFILQELQIEIEEN